MNNKHLASLLQTGYTTVSAIFIQRGGVQMLESMINPKVAQTNQTLMTRYLNQVVNHKDNKYTYKINFAVSVGDVCLAETASGLALVQIAEVHETPQIDVEAEYDYRWLISPINFSDYIKTVRNEKLLKQEIHRAEISKRCQELRKEIIGSNVKTESFEAAIEANQYNLIGHKELEK